jgi:hypothetical protein
MRMMYKLLWEVLEVVIPLYLVGLQLVAVALGEQERLDLKLILYLEL